LQSLEQQPLKMSPFAKATPLLSHHVVARTRSAVSMFI
jgi:hypothetical protein